VFHLRSGVWHALRRPAGHSRRSTCLVAPRLPGRSSLSVALNVVCDMMRSLALIGDTHSPDALIIADDSTVNGLVGRWVGEYADQAARVPNRFAHPQCYTSDGVSCPAARSVCIRHCSWLDTLICHYSVSPAVRRVAYITSTRSPHAKVDFLVAPRLPGRPSLSVVLNVICDIMRSFALIGHTLTVHKH
jgi:hypothetical protein